MHKSQEAAAKNDYDYIIVCVTEEYTREIYDTCVRYRTFELIANEIKRQQTEESVAELGVF